MLKKNVPINVQTNALPSADGGGLFNLHTLIYEHLSAMQPGWKMAIRNSPSTDNTAEIILYHKSSKKPKLWYGFFITQEPHSPGCFIYINPANGTLDSSDAIDHCQWLKSVTLYDVDDIISKHQVVSFLTIGIGKQGLSCFISVTPRGGGYTLMNAITGEDTVGDVYAYSPSIPRSSNSTKGLEMVFSSRDETGNVNDVAVNWSTYSDGSPYWATDNTMGIVANSDILILSPFVNPINGSICPDLFIPLLGPDQSSRLYEVTINGRMFITGASWSASSIDSLIADINYNVTYKAFMEV